MANAETDSVFVQGGARGLGLAFVTALLERKNVETVFASTRNTESDSLLRLKNQHRDKLRIIHLDLHQEHTIEEAAATVRRTTDTLTLLLNVAGILHNQNQGIAPEKKLEQCSSEKLTKVFQVNAFGPILMAKHFAPLLCHGKHAVIANLSARVGSIEDNRLGGWYAYRASKAAQNMFTKTLSIELARRSKELICVALHPGTVDTDLSKPFQRSVPQNKLFGTERASRQLLDVIDHLNPADTGKFFAWDGA